MLVAAGKHGEIINNSNVRKIKAGRWLAVERGDGSCFVVGLCNKMRTCYLQILHNWLAVVQDKISGGKDDQLWW